MPQLHCVLLMAQLALYIQVSLSLWLQNTMHQYAAANDFHYMLSLS